MIARERFDLYLLDYWLPGGQNLSRDQVVDLSAPIVFYSGAGLDSERVEAIEAGAQDYLVKPGDATTLVETVRRLMR